MALIPTTTPAYGGNGVPACELPATRTSGMCHASGDTDDVTRPERAGTPLRTEG